MSAAPSSPSFPQPRRRLPIGLQTLREIREQGHYYVDKTGLAIDLIESGKACFLVRIHHPLRAPSASPSTR